VTSKKFVPAMDFMARELAPLETIPRRKVPPTMTEQEAIRTFFALTAPVCPLLAHLPDYGFDLRSTRDFLTTFAGQEIQVPSRRTRARAWDDFQIWMAVETLVARDVHCTVVMARQKVATKLKLPLKKVEEVHSRFREAYRAVCRLKNSA
jgi:hypothetical protein